MVWNGANDPQEYGEDYEEAEPQDDRPRVIRVTSAPAAYDGFGTATVETLDGIGTRGRTYRRVQVVEEHEEWQRARYLSGMYVCLPEDEFAKWVDWGLA